jgi:hypothetical protein
MSGLRVNLIKLPAKEDAMKTSRASSGGPREQIA